MNLNRNEVATTHTKSTGRLECCHEASLHWSLLQSSIRQYMGSCQVHTCILFYGLVCSHSGSARSTSPQPNEVLSIVVSVVVLRPWSIPRRMEMATLVLCGDICVDGFASLGEQLCCIHCCHLILLFMHEHNKLFNLLKCLLWQICILTTKF